MHNNIIFFFTSNLVHSLDSAFVDRCCIEEEVSTSAIECVFEILRMEINSLINHGAIVSETMIYEEFVDMSDDSPSIPWTSFQTPKGLSQPSSRQAEATSQIPDRQWADSHWPLKATTAVSELYKIALLAKGLSGRKLKGLVTHAHYKYLVDEPGDLRDLLIALETVVRKKTGQCGVLERSEWDTQARGEGSDNMEGFLSALEAGGKANNVKR